MHRKTLSGFAKTKPGVVLGDRLASGAAADGLDLDHSRPTQNVDERLGLARILWLACGPNQFEGVPSLPQRGAGAEIRVKSRRLIE